MTEKKSLNFDFLDEKPKKAGVVENAAESKVSTTEERPVQKIESKKVPFFEFFKELFTNFPKFAQDYLTKKNPPYWLLVMWIMGMGAVADRMIDTIKDSNGWGEVWAIVLFGGILGAAIAYYIQGWFYGVRIKWSKGTLDQDSARQIWLYSTFPISAVSVLSLIFCQIAYGSDFFDYYYGETTTVEGIFIFLSLVAIVYSIIVSYKSVRKVAKVEKGLAIWWFIVAPLIFYILIAIGGAASS